MIKNKKLPTWFCQCCHKMYYEDNFRELGGKCTECGAVHKLCLTVTESKYNVDGSFTDKIVYQKELNDKKEN